jgi:hypothetical protein
LPGLEARGEERQEDRPGGTTISLSGGVEAVDFSLKAILAQMFVERKSQFGRKRGEDDGWLALVIKEV